ncbi:hypothetical protein [Methylocucumis oryzae]|uniref:hypothetical protein n=1 Tax=Methylocucumis oryzae TaxID=1632867 RepID=UPI000AF5EEFA|nr:hypothetical protein [Methylocucumis oryzae]
MSLKIFDAFGLGRLANPLEAHVNYDKDDRVIALIAHGLNNLSQPKIIKDRCHWVETID